MGWFDNLKNSFKSLGNKINYGVRKYILSPAKSAAASIKAGATTVLNTAKSAVSTLHQDARDLIGGAGNLIKRGQDTVGNLINKGADTITGLGKSLSMPLMIGVGVLGAIFLLNKK